MTDRALPDLVGRTRLDNSALRKGAAEAKAQIAGIGKHSQGVGGVIEGSFAKSASAITSRLGPAAGIAQKALEGIGASAFKSGNILQTALVGGAAAAVVGLGALAAKGVGTFIALTDQVRGLQRVTGASAQDASVLAGTLRKLGIDSGVAEKGFFLLSKTIANTPDKLAKVGVEVERNKKGNVDLFGTLENVATAYQKAGKGAEGNAIAAAAFGKAGAQMLPVLGKTREELDAIKARLGDQGLIFNQDAVNRGLEFKRNMRDLGESVKGLEVSLGEGLVPILAKLAKGAADFVTSITKGIRDVSDFKLPGGSDTVGTSVGKAWDLGTFKFAEDAGKRLSVALGITKKSHDDTKEAADKHAASEEDIGRAMQETAAQAEEEAKALDRLLGAQVGLVGGTLGLEAAQRSLKDAQQEAKEKQDALTLAVQQHGAKSAEAVAANDALGAANLRLKEGADRLAKQTADLAKQQAEASGQTFSAQQYTDAYKGSLLETAKAIGGPVGKALEDLAAGIEGLPPVELGFTNYQEFLNQIKTVVDRLNAIPGAVSYTARAGILPGSHQVPARMAGGPVIGGQPYIVGERRPELFIPNTSGRIEPRVPEGWDMNGPGVPAPGGSTSITVNFPNYLGSRDEMTRWVSEALRQRDVSRS